MSLDPRTRRDLHFEARAKSLKALGVEVKAEVLTAQVVKDLQLVDRMRADGLIGGGVKRRRKKLSDVARPEAHADSLARKAGGSLQVKAVNSFGTESKGRKLTGVEAERTMAMVARMNLLKRRAGRVKANQTIEQGPYEFPKFAAKIAGLGLGYGMRTGGFRGLSDGDAYNLMRRKLEDICDESNAAVGFNWWVR